MSIQVSKTGNLTRIFVRSVGGSETLIAYKRDIDGKILLGHRGLRIYDLGSHLKTSSYKLGSAPARSKRLAVAAADLIAKFEEAGIPAPAVLPPLGVSRAVHALAGLARRQPGLNKAVPRPR